MIGLDFLVKTLVTKSEITDFAFFIVKHIF